MKATKIAIVVSIFLVVIGTITAIAGLFALGFDMTRLSNLAPVTHTYVLDGEIKNISVEAVETSVKILPSEDEKAKVVSRESDKIYHRVNLTEETLSINRIDERKWYEFIGIIVDNDMELEIYLPKRDYENLYINSVSGNIFIPKDFTFEEAEIKTVSGDTEFVAKVKKEFNVETVSGMVNVGNVASNELYISSISGRIDLKSIESEHSIGVKTVSGYISMEDISAKKITAESMSGRIAFDNVVAFDEIYAESISGSINLNKSDASTLKLKSTSGNIIGNLLSEKIFVADTVSGNITLPEVQKGGRCEVKTISGNIQISIVSE